MSTETIGSNTFGYNKSGLVYKENLAAA